MSRTRTWLHVATCAVALLAVHACKGDGSSTSRGDEPTPIVGGSGGVEGHAGSGSGGTLGSGGVPGSGGTHAPVTKDGGASAVDASLPAPNIGALLDKNCAQSTMQSELLPSNMLFVIDRSSSMACNPPPTTDSATCEADPMQADPMLLSKWEITRKALLVAIDKLPDETVVGISYFSNDDQCGVHSLPSVPVAPLGASQRQAVEASLAHVEPAGATPLVGATILAYSHLHELALNGSIRGNKFVVLLTDGEQSEACSDPDLCSTQAECTKLLIDDEVPKAAGPGVNIKTFVIGAPGSEPARSTLSAIAKNGGTAPADCDVAAGNCHFDMTKQTKFDQALADALSQIAGRALSCELPVPKPSGMPFDPQLVNVVYSPADKSAPALIRKDERSCDGGADGWQYADSTHKKIRLCGPTCMTVRGDRGARVDVVLGCPVPD